MAHLIATTKCCLYSQWFPGAENCEADSLSRDFHLHATKKTHLVTSLVSPQQLPVGFILSPLPTEISCWLTLLPWHLEHRRKALGFARLPTKNPSAMNLMPSLTTWTGCRGGASSAPLPPPCKPPTSVMTNLINLQRAQLALLLAAWRRPSGYITSLTHDTTTVDECLNFYLTSSAATKIQTPVRNNIRQ